MGRDSRGPVERAAATAVRVMSERACRETVAVRSGGICERCGQSRGHSMHHRLKRSQGGLWTASNIVHVCGDGTRGCHGWIEANPGRARRTGWHCGRGDDPATTPIVLAAWGPDFPVLLDDDGMLKPWHGSNRDEP